MSTQTTLQQQQNRIHQKSPRPEQTRLTRHSKYTIPVFVFDSEFMFRVEELHQNNFMLKPVPVRVHHILCAVQEKILRHSKRINPKRVQNPKLNGLKCLNFLSLKVR